MRRREFIRLFVNTAVAWPLAPHAQAGKLPSIGADLSLATTEGVCIE
jgi:hypothetical protein